MKILKFVIVFIILLVIVGWIGYSYYVPRMVTQSMETGKAPEFLPESYQTVIESATKVVNEELTKLPEDMNRYDLTYEELLAFAEQVENEEILNALDEMRRTDLQSTGEAFDIAMQHVKADLPQSGKVRQLFSDRISLDRLKGELANLENGDIPLEVQVDMARRIGIQVLKDRKEEIKKRLTPAR